MSTYVIGDIHGSHLAVLQCLERCDFDPIEDTLISLGDVCDGWPFVKETVEILQAIPNFQAVIGNHDMWAMGWAKNKTPIPKKQLNCVGHHFDRWGRTNECLNCGMTEETHLWISQGGLNTVKSFDNDPGKFPIDFFENFAMNLESDGQVFVHGGLDPNQKILAKQSIEVCTWDRDLVEYARGKHWNNPDYKFGGWKDIFVGHTTTQRYEKDLIPLHFCNVWMIDTGGGWTGKLTIMDIDTKKYWQSDLVPDLYPDIKGRH